MAGFVLRPVWDQSNVPFLFFKLVHGPSTKTRVAYILSLLRDPTGNGNDNTVMEEEEDESDVDDGDITMLDTKVTSSAFYVTPKY